MRRNLIVGAGTGMYFGNSTGGGPFVGLLKKTAVDMAAVSAFPDWNRDFNGAAYDSTFRGAYSGEGVNPGWALALAQKPAP